MFILALLIGIYAYSILFIGKIGYLNLQLVSFITGLIIILSAYIIYQYASRYQIEKKQKSHILYKLKHIFHPKIQTLKTLPLLDQTLIALIITAILIHIVGALGPEFWFDSLWYHLTLPKLYIQNHAISYIPGNLFYYSAMPQLIELLYIPALMFKGEILAKLIHLLFAILTTYGIIILGKKLFTLRVGLTAALIFITDLSVAWLSSTAYIDLGRTFFELTAFSLFIDWWQTRKHNDLIKSGLIAGLAVSTKYLALGMVGGTALLIIFYAKTRKLHHALFYLFATFATSSYWFINAYLNTGNPLYPIFTKNLDSSHELVFKDPLELITGVIKLSNFPNDWLSPISPLYLVIIPFVIYLLFTEKKQLLTATPQLNPTIKLLTITSGLAVLIWLFTPNTGGSRFIVPYLPLLSLLAASIVTFKQNHTRLGKIIFMTIFIVASGNLLLRLYINKKNLPFLLGIQTKHEFLSENLNYNEVFYDLNGDIQKIIKPQDKVYLVGSHSLYYYPFHIEHESFTRFDDSYDYVITQHKHLPREIKNAKVVYYHPTTDIMVLQIAK